MECLEVNTDKKSMVRRQLLVQRVQLCYVILANVISLTALLHKCTSIKIQMFILLSILNY